MLCNCISTYYVQFQYKVGITTFLTINFVSDLKKSFFLQAELLFINLRDHFPSFVYSFSF
jgi:hypothetical protein